MLHKTSYEQELQYALDSIKNQYNNTKNINSKDINELFLKLIKLTEEIMQAYTVKQLTKPSNYYNKGYYIGDYLAGVMDGMKKATKDEKIFQIAVAQIASGIQTNIMFYDE